MAYEAELAAAQAAATANTNAEASAKKLFDTLAGLIASLKTGTTDPATAAAITALAAQVQATADDLSAAVVANTPAA